MTFQQKPGLLLLLSSTMLCPRCENLDFQFLDDLPSRQQSVLQSIFKNTSYWEGDQAEHYYYCILHERSTAFVASVEQGCHLCCVIEAAFSSRSSPSEYQEATNLPSLVVLRLWSWKQRAPFAKYISTFPSGPIKVLCGGLEIRLDFRWGLGGGGVLDT